MLLLKARGSGQLFFFCPICGVAWPELPDATRLDSIYELAQIAPDGAVLPTPTEARQSGLDLREVPYDVWYEMVERIVGP